ncbi:hypothetical protein WN55_03869 [Dufourea novaeangliae]|uniref:Uncharacterized protein n=1 Tax=Dufourea novaeangliae TaxID=178035 RepID=A0A154NYC8_DUFNO|nr:hypothetical protein WN55_03869 [Dufourea novaeangliae]
MFLEILNSHSTLLPTVSMDFMHVSPREAVEPQIGKVLHAAQDQRNGVRRDVYAYIFLPFTF